MSIFQVLLGMEIQKQLQENKSDHSKFPTLSPLLIIVISLSILCVFLLITVLNLLGINILRW